MKVFLDANIFVAASGNPIGGSAYLFQVALQDPTWHLLTSALALFEARLNVQKKLPGQLDDFHQYILSPALSVVQPPPTALIQLSHQVINLKDAPILAAAVCTQANYLCTLDKKDFHQPKIKQWCKRYQLKIVTPGDLLLQWRKAHSLQ